jgi:diadenosine tetraphosphate (Ap4A) HIT family hydrolase
MSVTFTNGDLIGFVILERDAAELHLTLVKGHRGGSRNVAHLTADDAVSLHDHLLSNEVRIIKGLRDADYGLRGFVFADPTVTGSTSGSGGDAPLPAEAVPEAILGQAPSGRIRTRPRVTVLGMQTGTTDADAYAGRLQADNAAGRCFICELADERTTPEHETVAYRDEHCVVFFSPWPRLYGYCLLAPRPHVTGVVSDFTEDGYLALQRRVHRLGRVLAEITPTERLYVFSFGSMQGVAHVHWHVAPLPPGVPFREQQFAAVDKPEYLVVPREDVDELARRISAGMTALAEAAR